LTNLGTADAFNSLKSMISANYGKGEAQPHIIARRSTTLKYSSDTSELGELPLPQLYRNRLLEQCVFLYLLGDVKKVIFSCYSSSNAIYLF